MGFIIIWGPETTINLFKLRRVYSPIPVAAGLHTVKLSSCLAVLVSQPQSMCDGTSPWLPYPIHTESDQFKSPQFRGHPGQLNNSQPVITEPSPDGDFPFFRPCDYATQNPVTYHCGWNLYIEHLPLYYSFKALGQATFYSLNLSQGDSSFGCNFRINCQTVAWSSTA